MNSQQIEDLVKSYLAAVELSTLLEQDETLSRYIDAEMQKMTEEGKIVMPTHRRLDLHDKALDRAYTWITRLRWQVRILEFIVLVLVIVVGLIVPTLDPPIWERWSAAKEVAEEMIQSESEAAAAGIPGARTGNIQIPDDIESPEHIGRLYPEGTAFIKTQGPHGSAYFHNASDYASLDGESDDVLSLINGIVTAVYTDGYANPTVIVENSHYRVTYLHFRETLVQIGDRVSAGQKIGDEGNLGYTLCRDEKKPAESVYGPNCGYHVHIDLDHQIQGQLDVGNYLDRYLGGQ